MRVKDKLTGNVLESENQLVVEQWLKDPARFLKSKGSGKNAAVYEASSDKGDTGDSEE